MDLYYIRNAIYLFIVVHGAAMLFIVFMLGAVAGRLRDVARMLSELVRESRQQRGNP
jgi:hypothetical protein